MQTKLTLSIDKQIIQKAKVFARKSNRSLSDIVENYLTIITDHQTEVLDHELSQIIGVIELPEDFNEKKETRDILIEKHL